MHHLLNVDKYGQTVDRINGKEITMYSNLHTNKQGKIAVRISSTPRTGYMTMNSVQQKGVKEALRKADQSLRARNRHGENVKPFYLSKLDAGFVHISQSASAFVPVAIAAGQYVEVA